MSHPSPSSSSTSSEQNRNRRRSENAIWSNWPSFDIMLPPTGLHSPTADERCFTYCQQSIRGRVQNQPPKCRSICFRKVFRHEVRRAMRMHEIQETIKDYERRHGNFPESIDATVEVNHPLPPEGQKSQKQDTSPISLSEAGEMSSSQTSASSPSRDEVRHWQPGWYLWTSRNPYDIADHFNAMHNDLSRQEQMRARREHTNEMWKRVREGKVPESALLAPLPWYPDFADGTALMQIPPPHVVVGEAIHKYLEPTWKLLSIVRDSIESGRQQELMQRMYDKALTPEPWILARNVCSRMWKVLNDGPPDDDGEETNKGGKL